MKIIAFGILFAVLIMSYILSERSKKKSKSIPVGNVKQEPEIGNVTPIVQTSHKKVEAATRQLLRSKMHDEKVADSFRVARGKMTDEEFSNKWEGKKVS